MVGRYSFEIRLWVNKKSSDSDPNVSSKFQADVKENFVERSNLEREEPEYFSLDVPKWE
jgi:hypothetical protein